MMDAIDQRISYQRTETSAVAPYFLFRPIIEVSGPGQHLNQNFFKPAVSDSI
jgi:hypothetical protein